MSTVLHRLNSGLLTVVQQAESSIDDLLVTSVSADEENRILTLLSPDSLTNVIIAGFIRDNGFSSARNRGQFYAYRNKAGDIEGVALIGHTILLHAGSSNAIKAFASIARRTASKHLFMVERQVGKEFWKYYAEEAENPRIACPILFLRAPVLPTEVPQCFGLRPATPEDLDHLMHAHAQMIQETSKINPLQKDPRGFRERYLRRIEQKRVWVLIAEGKLIFKADILAESSAATYIEGVYVNPEQRGKGMGRRCMNALGQTLQDRTKAIYLFVENDQISSIAFYLSLGFEIGGQYDLLYF